MLDGNGSSADLRKISSACQGFFLTCVALRWVLHVYVEPDRFKRERAFGRTSYSWLSTGIFVGYSLKRQTEINIGDDLRTGYSPLRQPHELVRRGLRTTAPIEAVRAPRFPVHIDDAGAPVRRPGYNARHELSDRRRPRIYRGGKFACARICVCFWCIADNTFIQPRLPPHNWKPCPRAIFLKRHKARAGAAQF